MSTSTQDKTNTSLPLPQERNSYTSTPYLVLTACMARKKWPQGWLTHPILLVKVCRLSYFEEIIKGWGKCLAINDFHKTGSWCQDGLATEMTRFEFNFTFNLKPACDLHCLGWIWCCSLTSLEPQTQPLETWLTPQQVWVVKRWTKLNELNVLSCVWSLRWMWHSLFCTCCYRGCPRYSLPRLHAWTKVDQAMCAI